MKVRQYRGEFLKNQNLPGSQGALGQLSTGPSGPLEVVLVNWKKIFRPSFSYGASIVLPVVGRLVQWVPVGRWYGAGQAERQIGKGLENVTGKSGLGCRWTGGRVSIWVKLRLGVGLLRSLFLVLIGA